MIVHTLRCRNIRNHVFSEVHFGSGVNVISGANGHGKTSLLECISLIALTKSFVPGPDKSWIRAGEDQCDIKALCTSTHGTACEISMHAEKRVKEFALGDEPITPRALLGTVPVVAMSPDMRAITTGGPSERRKMLDIALSQSDSVYLDNLVRYKKALQQRNALLKDADGIGDMAGFDAWTETLCTLGAAVVSKRIQFVSQLRERVKEWYATIAQSNEHVHIVYKCEGLADEDSEGESGNTVSLLESRFRDAFRAIESREMRNGRTLIGPHLDDLHLELHDMPFRDAASQGQHKTMLISLKLAEFSLLRDRCRETPIVLFDDVFSELDAQRAHNVVEVLARDAQVFVTTTDEHVLADIREQGPEYQAYRVEHGTVTQL